MLSCNISNYLIKHQSERHIVIADIEPCFTNCLGLINSFFWWKNGDVNEQPQDYHMNVYIFGGTLSPSCSNCTLQRTARDDEQKYIW